ncbi:MAG: lipoprotein [Desulfuromonadales bacterium]|nr:lipoprotein [Desulfuromonadales bacterium]
MKKILILLILSTLFLSGCQTFHGIGKDFEQFGGWLQRNSD